jgi:hexosaminidase
MKNSFIIFLVCIISFSGICQEVRLIPAVNNAKSLKDEYLLNATTTISFDINSTLEDEALYLQKLIGESSSFETKVEALEAPLENSIFLSINGDYLIKGEEAYTIDITHRGLDIEGATEAGIMRGIQTLRQLFPPAFHAKQKKDSWTLQGLQLADYPAFKHRGFMLDVCRHYFDAGVVKEYIDLLAFYRMNVLHLHLTEDQGWRFASEKYPLLNTISSERTELNGKKYGGLFTKEELKDIVAYATERHIEIIPEIEMPGHSQAALAAYPHLSCTGEDIEVANDWGVFKEIYCAGNDSTFAFLEAILLEVIEIFPSKYIHIGGDEAPKQRWEQCSKCQKRIADEGLKDEHELQSYFIKRIEKFLAQHDRKIIGWDEILEGGLSENATVQSWRGYEGGIEAANQKHQVIMSPTSHCYLDYGLASIDIQKIYSFDPQPTDPDFINYDYIIGGECNMWTEHVPDRKTLDKMVFPRIIAFAEALWASPSENMFPYFYKRLQTHYPVLDAFGIQYGQEMIPVKLKDTLIGEASHVVLNHASLEFSSKYKWECASCEDDFSAYTAPIALDKSGTLIILPLKNHEVYGPIITQDYASHLGLRAKPKYESEINKWYMAGGEQGLINGKIGSIEFRDGNWQGFWGDDISVELSFDDVIEIESITMNFYHYANAWIVQPSEVIIQTSKDGNKWGKPITIELEKPTYDNIKKIETANYTYSKKKDVKFIKIVCVNSGKMPENHDAAGEPSWIFIDEIIVE